MIYLRTFQTAAEYSAATIVTPNVSLIKSDMSLRYNPYVSMLGDLKITYDITETTEVFLFKGASSGSGSGSGSGGFAPAQMWIDGVEITPTDKYTFATTGDHIVEYKLVQGETAIPNFIFSNIHIIKDVEIGNGVTRIGEYAFYYCSLTSVTIPNSVTIIDGNAFLNSYSLTSIEIPDSVTSIGSNAFNNCSGLTSVTIGSGVSSLGYHVFYNCTSLPSVTIPSGVVSFDSETFTNCSGLTSITVEATTPPTLGSYVFDNTNNCPIYVPSGSVSAYQSSWSDYSSRIQAIP